MSEQQWYYARSGERHGPLTSAQLRAMALQGELRPDDEVWRMGLPGWQPAARVRGLFEGASSPSQAAVPVETILTSPSSAPTGAGESGTDNEIPQFVSDTGPATSRGVVSSYRSAARRRFTPAQSWTDIFDWKFEKYLTPWIVRITWITCLVLSAVSLLFVGGGLLMALAPEVDHSNTSRSTVEFRLPIEESGGAAKSGRTVPFWMMRRVWAVFGAVFSTVMLILCLLWIRVILECVIVVFNISATLKEMNQRLPT